MQQQEQQGIPITRLAGKLAVVLGAAGPGNIGQAIARRFVLEGARVIVAGRRTDPLQEFALEIGARACECDITAPADLQRLFGALDQPLDVAVNTVGRNQTIPFMETTAQDLDELCRLHVIGPLLFIQAAIRAMPAGGSIIHISSVSANLMMHDHVGYIATKAAGEALVKAAAFEFGARGVRVNAIAPALTRTPMTEHYFADADFVGSLDGINPLGRVGTVAEIAAAATWLASDECFMTGEVLQVNGGMALPGLARPG